MDTSLDDDAYFYSIFACNEEFSFGRNGNLDEFDRKSLDALKAALNNPAFRLLPLRFDTGVLDDKGNRIAGVFEDNG